MKIPQEDMLPLFPLFENQEHDDSPRDIRLDVGSEIFLLKDIDLVCTRLQAAFGRAVGLWQERFRQYSEYVV